MQTLTIALHHPNDSISLAREWTSTSWFSLKSFAVSLGGKRTWSNANFVSGCHLKNTKEIISYKQISQLQIENILCKKLKW